jgi:hypothetical protein
VASNFGIKLDSTQVQTKSFKFLWKFTHGKSFKFLGCYILPPSRESRPRDLSSNPVWWGSSLWYAFCFLFMFSFPMLMSWRRVYSKVPRVLSVNISGFPLGPPMQSGIICPLSVASIRLSYYHPYISPDYSLVQIREKLQLRPRFPIS